MRKDLSYGEGRNRDSALVSNLHARSVKRNVVFQTVPNDVLSARPSLLKRILQMPEVSPFVVTDCVGVVSKVDKISGHSDENGSSWKSCKLRGVLVKGLSALGQKRTFSIVKLGRELRGVAV